MMQEQRPDWKLSASAQPWAQLLPAPLVHADLASRPSLSVANQHGSAPVVKVVLGERERLLDAEPARHKTTIIARSLKP
jgi:hypothetical protein